MENNKSFIEGSWYKYKDYKIYTDKKQNRYVSPVIQSGRISFDPLLQNRKLKNQGKNQIFRDLMFIAEIDDKIHATDDLKKKR